MDLFYVIVAAVAMACAWAVSGFILFHLSGGSQHLPHSYSTGISHKPTPGESCICPVGNCSICGEGR